MGARKFSPKIWFMSALMSALNISAVAKVVSAGSAIPQSRTFESSSTAVVRQGGWPSTVVGGQGPNAEKWPKAELPTE